MSDLRGVEVASVAAEVSERVSEAAPLELGIEASEVSDVTES